MSAAQTENNNGWIPTKKTWSIDRAKQRKPYNQNGRQRVMTPHNKIVKEKIPNVIVDMLVEDILKLVGNKNWNDPENVAETIAEMMSIDLSKPTEEQIPKPVEIDRTVFVPASKGSDIPYWVCQSIIRVDEKFGNRFIDYKGAKYNKIDIIFENSYFKERMDQVAKVAHCKWNARWGNAKKEEHRLYQKTRTGSQSDESWLERCVKHLLTEDDIKAGGINIKNLVMIEFKRNLDLLKQPDQTESVVIETVEVVEEDSHTDSDSDTDSEE